MDRPQFVDGVKIEGTFRTHQVPLAQVRENEAHLKLLEGWMHSYRPTELFDEIGRALRRRARAPAAGPLARSPRLLTPTAASCSGRSVLPDYEEYDVELRAPGVELRESTRQFGVWLRDLLKLNPDNFRIVSPDELNSNRLGSVLEVSERVWEEPRLPGDDHLAPGGRVLEVLSEHLCEGWLEGYLLSGRHGLFATYEAFAMVVASMIGQHAKWLEMSQELKWRAAWPRSTSCSPRPAGGTITTASRTRGPAYRHRGLQAGHGGARLPAARRELPALGGRALPLEPQLRQLDRH